MPTIAGGGRGSVAAEEAKPLLVGRERSTLKRRGRGLRNPSSVRKETAVGSLV